MNKNRKKGLRLSKETLKSLSGSNRSDGVQVEKQADLQKASKSWVLCNFSKRNCDISIFICF